MFKTKLCLGTLYNIGVDVEEQIRMFKKAGFEGFFTAWNQNLKKYRKVADETGMIFQSVHAPFDKAAIIWQNNAESQEAVDELLTCVRDCAKINVPILVVHPFKGFEEKENPTQDGINNLRIVVEEAKKLNVTIAFENVEGEAYLEALMKTFDSYDNVGFCWDSGHELCYNRGKDMLALYGKKLVATHINDNLGISDYDGKIFWTDDLHLLPFDGIANWNDVARRLNDCGYDDILSFELTLHSKPGRHENDKYKNMKIEEYISECYSRACRIAYLKNGQCPAAK